MQQYDYLEDLNSFSNVLSIQSNLRNIPEQKFNHNIFYETKLLLDCSFTQ